MTGAQCSGVRMVGCVDGSCKSGGELGTPESKLIVIPRNQVGIRVYKRSRIGVTRCLGCRCGCGARGREVSRHDALGDIWREEDGRRSDQYTF